MLGHQNPEALRQSLNNAQHHPVHPVGGAEGGQCPHTQRFSYDHRIHHGIQLLKYIADHQRQSKSED